MSAEKVALDAVLNYSSEQAKEIVRLTQQLEIAINNYTAIYSTLRKIDVTLHGDETVQQSMNGAPENAAKQKD